VDLPCYSFFFQKFWTKDRFNSNPNLSHWGIFIFSNFQLHLIATFSNSSTKCDLLGKKEKLKESAIIWLYDFTKGHLTHQRQNDFPTNTFSNNGVNIPNAILLNIGHKLAKWIFLNIVWKKDTPKANMNNYQGWNNVAIHIRKITRCMIMHVVLPYQPILSF